MNKDLIGKVEKWVRDVYENADHLIRTGYWVKKLNPKASDALYIAAITHDIERAFKEGRKPPSPETKGAKWDDHKYSMFHGKRSAKFVIEFLKKVKAGSNLIKEVSKLVIVHEEGGWKEADILRDADSISFLEVNVPRFISWIPEKLTKEEVREKFDYMFKRIGSNKAKQIAQPFYDQAIIELEKVNN